MRLTLEAALAIVVLMSTPAESAHGQGGAVPLATYVDVMPNAVDAATALLEQYRLPVGDDALARGVPQRREWIRRYTTRAEGACRP